MSRLRVLVQVFNPKSKIVKQFKKVSCRRKILKTLEEQREKLFQIENFISFRALNNRQFKLLLHAVNSIGL